MTLDPQITTAIFGVVAAAITGLGAWGLSILERKLGIDKNDRAQAAFEGAISNGIALGASTVASRIGQGGTLDKTSALNAVVTAAAAYAGPKVAPEMKTLGMDPSTLVERVAARVAASPDAEPAITDALNAAQLQRK